MTEEKKIERGRAGSAETSHIAAYPAPSRRRRLTAARKQEAVLRVLRGEDVELVARSLEATAADVNNWRMPQKTWKPTTAGWRKVPRNMGFGAFECSIHRGIPV